jgi:hypothetical protein
VTTVEYVRATAISTTVSLEKKGTGIIPHRLLHAEAANSVRERWILVAAIVNATTAGVKNICVANRRLRLVASWHIAKNNIRS